jgi:CheY-like chemotaxis protein
MKILVVDDEQHFGSLVCRTLKRLGHNPILALHPWDALEIIDSEIDAVISDIDMPAMNGVELAGALRERRRDLPIAFCTGSDPERDLVHEAASYGSVLPAPWTIAQMQTLVDSLHRGHVRGSSPRAQPQTTSDINIELSVASWDEVEQLCDRRAAGPVNLTVAVPDIDEACPVTMTLLMPDGFTVSLRGEIRSLHVDPSDGTVNQTVELVGLTMKMAVRLRALATGATSSEEPARCERRPHHGWVNELALGSREMKVSDLIMSNKRLKDQIESLASKMRPRHES